MRITLQNHDDLKPQIRSTWKQPFVDSKQVRELIDRFHLNPLLAQVLISRGFSSSPEIRDYLYPSLGNLHDPYLLPSMKAAVLRITRAIREKEPVLIYGDNDIDGMTGVAILTEFLHSFYPAVFFYLPDYNRCRKTILLDSLDYAKHHSCSLIISVDCGVTAVDQIRQIKKSGIDIIVTDHHEPIDLLPQDIPIVNPKLACSQYPNREITGAGVAFKLIHAIAIYFAKKQRDSPDIHLKHYLDLVALGTIADMGMLLGENRIFASHGIAQLRICKRKGLLALLRSLNIAQSTITIQTILSKISPCINSLGRVGDANKGIDLFLSEREQVCEKLVEEIKQHNQERKRLEKIISNNVYALLRKKTMSQEQALVFSSKEWHSGIIAIIASRFSRLFHLPCAVISVQDGIGKGSLRTIPQFPLLPLLKKHGHLFVNFGGHNLAAGIAIEEKNIPHFTSIFVQEANRILSPLAISPEIAIDANVSFSDLSYEVLESLSLLEPCGYGNPPPVFSAIVQQHGAVKLIHQKHIKFLFQQNEIILEGIGLNMKQRLPIQKEKALHILFTPHFISSSPYQKLQLIVRDFF